MEKAQKIMQEEIRSLKEERSSQRHERNSKLANNLNEVMDDNKRQVSLRGLKSVGKQDSLKIN